MLPVAVDAMGGDNAPGEIVAGAVAARAEGIPVVLVGQPDVLAGLDTGDLDVIAASEVIGMDEDAGMGVRRKKDSSLVRAAEAVRDAKASAMVSAGNTGATMAAALLRMGRISGVHRPAIATVLPWPGTRPTILLDCGANAECTPAMLLQFAQMGAAFFAARFPDIGAEPKVGLLSIGEEPGKGDPLRKEAYDLFVATDFGAARFVGNVEGRDLASPDVDVIVTDGFTGNVALKTLEGGLRFLSGAVLGALLDPALAGPAAEVLPALMPIAEQLDPDYVGGAMLLGLRGVCIISHGSSSAKAILNAVKVARDMVEGDLVGHLASAVAATPSL